MSRPSRAAIDSERLLQHALDAKIAVSVGSTMQALLAAEHAHATAARLVARLTTNSQQPRRSYEAERGAAGPSHNHTETVTANPERVEHNITNGEPA